MAKRKKKKTMINLQKNKNSLNHLLFVANQKVKNKTKNKRKGEVMKEIKGVISFRELDKEIKKFWEDNEIYQKVKKLNEHYPEYYFVDGPPYCSGAIH